MGYHPHRFRPLITPSAFAEFKTSLLRPVELEKEKSNA